MNGTDQSGCTATPLESIRFERRSFERQSADGTVVACVTDLLGATRLARVRMCDNSIGGVGIVSSVAMATGSRVELHAKDHPVPTVFGTVVRCDAHADGFRIGIRSGARQQAA